MKISLQQQQRQETELEVKQQSSSSKQANGRNKVDTSKMSGSLGFVMASAEPALPPNTARVPSGTTTNTTTTSEMDYNKEHEDDATKAVTSNLLDLDAEQQQQHQQQPNVRNKLKNIVVGLLVKKKESKMDNLEAMINESAMKLLQQKELVFKQASCLQLDQLCKTTRFSRRELKWLYLGWKVACTDGGGVSTDSLNCGSDNSYGTSSQQPFLSSAYYGIINEQQFQQIYSQFFPYGGDCSFYAKYVFQAMFSETLVKNGGFITFADYAHALSALLRGTIDEKIDFVFRLYDLNQDNVITLDELSKIFFAVYRLLGDNVNQRHDQATYEEQAERLYRKIDAQESGSITREQFIDYCKRDSTIVDTIQMLEMSICSSA